MFGAADFAREMEASPQVMADMEAFRLLLTDWNGRMNLVGPSALATFWLRHAFDSAQLLAHAPDARNWADVGAGAGFPGIVLAILLRGQDRARVHLVESMAKRCRFLSEVVETLALPAVVLNQRGEDARIEGLDVVTARACAPLPRLFGFTARLLQPANGPRPIGLFLKGQGVEDELTEARRVWKFDAHLLPSRSDPAGRILRVERLFRVAP